MSWILILAAVVVVGLPTGWVGWISVQSLRQARVIAKAAQRGFSPFGHDETVAFHGKVEVPHPIRKHGKGELLWFRAKHERQEGSGQDSGWVSLGTEEETAVFRIQSGDREVRVEDAATEVNGGKSSLDYEYGNPGCLGAFSGGAGVRTSWKWLPVCDSLTVLGRLQRQPHGWVMVRDPKVGLLLTPQPPRRAALRELYKGLAGMALVGAVLATGMALLIVFR